VRLFERRAPRRRFANRLLFYRFRHLLNYER
jgi:hypothetical protein